MKNWKLAPKSESVAKYVECYWFLEKEPDDHGNLYPKLNPDPAAHLIIASDNEVHQYDHSGTRQVVQGCHWIFPHLKTLTMDHSDPFKIIGIKFRVGALYSLNLPDLMSILDKVEPVAIMRMFGSDLGSAEQLVDSAFEQRDSLCATLDDALSVYLSKALEDKHSELVRNILPILSDTPIAEIGEKLHRSQRTIERAFTRVTGLTMKQVHCMVRLEDMLNYLYELNDAELNWADIARKYEFSDQPHLIRHLKNSIGNTPAAYAQQRDLTIDVYGNFELN
ncbi:MAG: AraC family transcriptional regulator [Thalassolituus oleivorans]|nr:AraC family transcriptional regulator [Thalassolituus oleivorans]